MSILEVISSGKEYQFLASPTFQNTINESDSERLSKIYNYVIKNYYQEISLEKISSVACLSPQSFCRYFKNRTNKPFTQFLNEIRISNACRYLSEEDVPVSRICYICGYTNVSYFIKRFKEVTGLTPLSYKKNQIG
jgi:AraC-like DNA-binding protein